MIARYCAFALATILWGCSDPNSGSYIVLEFDKPALIESYLDSLLDDVHAVMRAGRVDYAALRLDHDRITVRIPEQSKRETAKQALSKIAQASRGQYVVTEGSNGDFSLQAASADRIGSQALDQFLQVVRHRIDDYATAELKGSNRILVKAPSISNPENLKRLFVTPSPTLNFRLVDMTTSVQTALAGNIPPTDELLWETDKAGNRTQPYLVRRRISVSGSRITRASAGFDPRSGEPMVNLAFDALGTEQFAETTKSNVNRLIAVVLGETVVSAPIVREPIVGGSVQVSGNFTIESANDLARLLSAGPLPSVGVVVEYGRVEELRAKDSDKRS